MSLKEEFEKLKLGINEAEGIDADPEREEVPEVEDVENFNVLILTSAKDSKQRKSKKNPTVVKIEEWCNSNDVPFYTAYADTAYLEKVDDGKIKIHNIGDKEGYEINRDNTFIIARRGVLFHNYSKNLMSRLERYRFCFLNERNCLEVCEDKY
ncbi:MAG: hypothetical protein GWO20_15540, partial [Candidatus Korarchaeota archaeon]|nr:hypothetical protein [Candidatus Korarchaeota archaeon]